VNAGPDAGGDAGKAAGAACVEHAQRRERLARALAAQSAAGDAPIGLAKRTSNLFRDRAEAGKRRLDVSAFDHVLAVDAHAGWIDVEGMTRYETAVDAALAQGATPAVVPQLKTITVGGAAAGVGIEATSFRHGLVHETLAAIDVLLADGSVVEARPDNAHADLFYGFPNSYGTLGYALRLRARTLPAKRFVRVDRLRFDGARAFFDALPAHCAGDADFVDAVVFAAGDIRLCLGRFVDDAPYASDYTFERIFWRSIPERDLDFLSARDYLWRWDTDWFWCSKNVGAQHPLLRRLYGRKRLGSRTYQRIMRLNGRLGLTRALDALRGLHPESVIQDVDVPVERAAEFLDFLLREIGILPVWVCPIRAGPDASRFTLYPMRPGALYVNFGFWDVVRAREPHPPGWFNRLVEAEVTRLGGVKSLYSDSFYTRDEFWSVFDADGYARLKRRYDPSGRLGELYEKCVLRR
jgi:FAD/FMN-containing dehydrogenase